MEETKILGVAISEWPADELLHLPWHAVSHLTEEERRMLVLRAGASGEWRVASGEK